MDPQAEQDVSLDARSPVMLIIAARPAPIDRTR